MVKVAGMLEKYITLRRFEDLGAYDRLTEPDRVYSYDDDKELLRSLRQTEMTWAVKRPATPKEFVAPRYLHRQSYIVS
jgi:hypothetical protein